MISLLLMFSSISYSMAGIGGEVDSVVWTGVSQASLLTPEQHKVAFRDVVAEKTIRRIFSTFLSTCRLYPRTQPGELLFPAELIISDPLQVKQKLDFHKKKDGLCDVDFSAWDLQLHGLHGMKLKNLHVLRHIGLRDLRVVVQIVADMKLTGQYKVQGTGLSMVPVTGSGPLSVTVKELQMTGETFLVVKENPLNGQLDLHIKELELMMTHNGLNVKLDNLLGGGLAGIAGNDILTMIGEDVLNGHKDMLRSVVKETFRKELSKFLEI